MTGSSAHTEVAELLDRAVRAGMAPGAVAAWGPGGADPPRQVAAGYARLVPVREPATESTWYDLASLTKPLVTGTLALLAVRERELGLDSTVGKVIGEAAGRPIGNATVRQLLAHSSGLPAWAPLYALAGEPQLAVEAVLSLELVGWPDQRVEYSCPGFILLAAMLERVFEQQLDVAFRERVVEPLELREAVGFRPRPSQQRARGRGGGAGDRAAAVHWEGSRSVADPEGRVRVCPTTATPASCRVSPATRACSGPRPGSTASPASTCARQANCCIQTRSPPRRRSQPGAMAARSGGSAGSSRARPAAPRGRHFLPRPSATAASLGPRSGSIRGGRRCSCCSRTATIRDTTRSISTH